MPLVTNFTNDILPYADFSLLGIEEKDLPVSLKDLLDLCGGIPSPSITGVRIEIFATFSSAFAVRICSDQYEAVRNMDFSIGRIDNNYLFINEQGKCIGTNLFLNQFQAARDNGFKRIHLTAMAPSEEEPDWSGYYFWACLGFQHADVNEFEAWAKTMGRKEPTLSDLMQTETGRMLWKATGFTWIGDFFLTEGYKCITHLKAHLQRKGIDFPIDP
jgi:hypothetical protein